MPKNTWWIASLLASLMLLGGAGYYSRQQKRELEKTRAELESIRKNAEDTNAQAERLLAGLEESKEKIEKLVKEKEEVARAQKDLESQMRTALESKDVTISELQGKLTVNILDRILFDSGEAILKPAGQAVLDDIAKVLANYPNRQIQVIGHTDNVPIRVNSRNPFHTNWELSAGRAIAAVRYLSEHANVDPRRLGALGYGEFHPIADNATAEGRAKNRRIALVVMPEEFVPTDVLPSATSTNAPSVTATNTASTNVVESATSEKKSE
jgi:chemotaxis protein MotB